MNGAFSPDAVGISLIKGIEFEEGKPVLISDLLQKEMAKGQGNPTIDMSVLMGANVANEVAKGDFAEATIGCTDLAVGSAWCSLFNTSDFKVDAVEDVAGAEVRARARCFAPWIARARSGRVADASFCSC